MQPRCFVTTLSFIFTLVWHFITPSWLSYLGLFLFLTISSIANGLNPMWKWRTGLRAETDHTFDCHVIPWNRIRSVCLATAVALSFWSASTRMVCSTLVQQSQFSTLRWYFPLGTRIYYAFVDSCCSDARWYRHFPIGSRYFWCFHHGWQLVYVFFDYYTAGFPLSRFIDFPLIPF